MGTFALGVIVGAGVVTAVDALVDHWLGGAS